MSIILAFFFLPIVPISRSICLNLPEPSSSSWINFEGFLFKLLRRSYFDAIILLTSDLLCLSRSWLISFGGGITYGLSEYAFHVPLYPKECIVSFRASAPVFGYPVVLPNSFDCPDLCEFLGFNLKKAWFPAARAEKIFLHGLIPFLKEF